MHIAPLIHAASREKNKNVKLALINNNWVNQIDTSAGMTLDHINPILQSLGALAAH